MSLAHQRGISTYKGNLSPETPSIKIPNHNAKILTPEHSLTMAKIPRPKRNVRNLKVINNIEKFTKPREDSILMDNPSSKSANSAL